MTVVLLRVQAGVETFADAADMLFLELGKTGKRDNALSQSIRDREPLPSPDTPRIGWLTMDRHRVMSGRPDPITTKRVLPCRPVVAFKHEEMHGMRRAGNIRRRTYRWGLDGPTIPLGDRAAPLVALIQARKLDSENGSLQFIQPGIASRDIADITFTPTILPQFAQALRQQIVVRDDGPAVSQRAKFFVG
jgi:hypothetical protein